HGPNPHHERAEGAADDGFQRGRNGVIRRGPCGVLARNDRDGRRVDTGRIFWGLFRAEDQARVCARDRDWDWIYAFDLRLRAADLELVGGANGLTILA